MNTTIQLANRDFEIVMHPATVIHVNKYTEAGGGWGMWPVWSRLYIDVVFRSKASGRDWPITIEDYEPPIYTDQEVVVIGMNEQIIGYIDKQNDQYYYTDTDFAGNFDFGMRVYQAVILAVLAFAVVLWLIPADKKLYAVFGPILIWLYYRIQRYFWNRSIEKKLDRILSSN